MMKIASFVAACALIGCIDAESDRVVDDGVIAQIERPTADGSAYTFKFSVVDGVVMKEVFTPAGQVPPADDECALDTFLRIAPDDAVVPIELRQSCASHDRPDLGPHAIVAEMRPVGLAFALGNATGPACSESAYNARFSTLTTAAAYVPTVNLPTGVAADSYYFLGGDGSCSVYNAHSGAFMFLCNPADISDDCPPGVWSCHTTYSPGPDPDCAHSTSWWGAYSPTWINWIQSTPTDTVSSARFEVSACASTGANSASWATRRHTSDAWGAAHVTNWNGSGLYQLSFDSGTVSGNWASNQYQFKASGNGVRPMYAGTRQKGQDRSECPSHLL